ncbi:hypothetical protein ACIRN4_23885 [Pimelobacter simplex]
MPRHTNALSDAERKRKGRSNLRHRRRKQIRNPEAYAAAQRKKAEG